MRRGYAIVTLQHSTFWGVVEEAVLRLSSWTLGEMTNGFGHVTKMSIDQRTWETSRSK